MDNMLQFSLDLMRNQAFRVLRDKIEIEIQSSDPIEFLKEYPWEELFYIGEKYTQKELRSWNAGFDPRGSFGRTILAVLLMEKYFPDKKVEVGEVLENTLARRALDQLIVSENQDERIILAKEVLTREEHHTVVVVDGKQFDPISSVLRDFEHPEIMRHDPWPALMSIQIIDTAMEIEDYKEREIYLQRAKFYCPELMLLRENLAVISMVSQEENYLDEFLKLSKIRPNAKFFFVLWLECGATDLFNRYPQEIYKQLEKDYESHLQSLGLLVTRAIHYN